MSRIDNIKKYAQNKEIEQQKKENDSIKRIEEYKEKIKELKPRIDELLEVGNACLEHGIPLSAVSDYRQSYETHQFISNGWSHLTGFISNGPNKPFTKVGKRGGGACNWELETDGVTIDIKGDAERVLSLFLRDFDKFESKFYEYVDKVTGQHSTCN